MKHVKSKRLSMFPMTVDEMNELIAKETNENLANLYIDIRDKAIKNLDQYKWYSTWKICLNDTGQMIGEFHFNGLNKNTTKMGYQVFEEYWGQGYTYEILDTMVNYALSQDEIYFIEMEIKADDEYKIKALEKLKFKVVAKKDDLVLYALEKPKSRMLIIFASIGLCIGLAVGISLKNIAIGVSVGLCLGALIGATIDKNDEDKRKESQEARIRQGQEDNQSEDNSEK